MFLEYYVLGMLLLSIMTGSIDGHASKPSGEGAMVRGRWLCDLMKSWPLLAKHHQAVETVVEIPTLLNQTSSPIPTKSEVLWDEGQH